MRRKERPLEITIRHSLDRDVLLELRDDIVAALEPLGIVLEATIDGTTVAMRDRNTTKSVIEAMAVVNTALEG